MLINIHALITRTAMDGPIDGVGVSRSGEKTYVKMLVLMSPRVPINHI